MTRPDFVHLHVHSDYSLFDGVSTLNELIGAASKMGMRAIALTDHGNMMGAVHFVKLAEACGIKPILGLEAYVALEDRRRRDKELDKLYYHLTLIATDEKGFKNLMAITTDAHLNGYYYKPRTDIAFLAEHSEGIIALSGCPKGEIPYVYQNQGETAALASLKKYLDIFGPENFYLELQMVGLEGYERVNRWLCEEAHKNGLSVIATNDVHYLRREDAYLQEILISLNSNRTQDDERYIKSEELYLRTPEEMAVLFSEVPEALSNTLELSERVGRVLDLERTSLRLPSFPLPEGFSSPDDYLARLAEDGFKRKFGDNPPEEYTRRLKHELSVIKETGFASYFLIIWDIIEMAKREGVPVGPGRGSGGASLVLHCLDVTKVDPIKYNLMFERFLNPQRISPPDVDIDFSDTKRERVIEAIKRKYGEESVAQIVTYSRLKARAAVKDVARFYKIPFADVDSRVSKLIPQSMSLDEALREIPELSRIAEENEDYARVFATAKRLEGHIRNLSVHAAGVVITPGKLWEHVPLITVNSSGGEKAVVTQFDMKSLEELGILKVDILGLRTLSVVERCLKLISEVHNKEIILDRIPLDDEKTFSLLAKGETASVFQLESPGMRRTLRNLNPTSIEDIFAVVALFRTGPLEAGMTEKYLQRKNGREPVRFPFPELEPILRDTYGVIVYQEQISQIAVALAGFTMGEADVLRYAIGKKKPDLMARMKEKFMEGAVGRGHNPKEVEALWDAMEEFAGYSFNRAHAASYGLFAYQTAYLKAHYPVEFMTAALNAAIDSSKTQEKIPPLVDEARRMGISVLPPDINASDAYFKRIDNQRILYGLAAIKNVGTSAISEIQKARKDGPFTSLEDFIARVSSKVNKRVIESLIKAGAFDKLDPDRKSLLERAEKMSGRTGGPSAGGLFIGLSSANGPGGEPDPEANIQFEKDVLGFYLTSSPLDKYPLAKLLDATPTSRLIECDNGDKVRVVGVLLNITRQKSKKGNYFAQVNIEDTEGRVPGIIFSEPLKKIGSVLREDKVYLFTGRVIVEMRETEEEEGEVRDVKITIEDAMPIEEVIRRPRRVTISLAPEDLGSTEMLSGIAECARAHPGDVPIAFRVICEKPKLLISRELRVAPDPAVLTALEGIVGKGRVGIG
ncbi:MAG: DNA polymerase III subunit alpha [candidate division WOR-3 bacterium]